MNESYTLSLLYQQVSTMINGLEPYTLRWSENELKFFEEVLYKFDMFFVLRYTNRQMTPYERDVLTDTKYLYGRADARFLYHLSKYILLSLELGSTNPIACLGLGDNVFNKFIELLITCCEETTAFLRQKLSLRSSRSSSRSSSRPPLSSQDQEMIQNTLAHIQQFYSCLIQFPIPLPE